MATFNIDLTGKGGLVKNFFNDKDKSSATPNRRTIYADGQMADGVYNPFTRLGYMSPSNTGLGSVTSNGSDLFDTEMRCSQLDEDNSQFYFGSGLHIWKGGSYDAMTLDEPETITGIGSSFTDFEIYQLNGVRKFFFSYRKTGASDIGYATLPYASSDPDWLSTAVGGDQFNLADGNHKMVTADNGYMYVLDGSTLHKIDGTVDGGTLGTATANILVFPPYLYLYDAVDIRGKLYIAVQDTNNPTNSLTSQESYSITAGIYVWDRQSKTISFTDFFPISGIQAIHKIYVAPDGSIRVMCTASDGTFQIKLFDGSAFITIAEGGAEAGPRYRDSVHVGGERVSWLASDGYMYAHGAVSSYDQEGIFKYGTISTDANYVAGAILYAGGNGLGSGSRRYESFYLTYDITTTSYVKKWIPNALTSATGIGFTQDNDIGNVYTPVFEFPEPTLVNYVHIFMLPTTGTGTTESATIKVYFNKSSTASQTFTITRNDTQKGYYYMPINKTNIHSIQFEIEFNVNTIAGEVGDFMPSRATIHYDETVTRKK